MSQTGYLFRRELKNLLKEELTVATDSNLLAHFRFNGNLTDSSGYGNTISGVASPVYVAGIAREALHISSGTASITLSAANDFDTIETWLKVISAPASLSSAVTFVKDAGTIKYLIGTNSIPVIQTVNGFDSSSYTHSTGPTSSFYHFVSVVDSDNVKHYINGAVVHTASTSIAAGSNTIVRLRESNTGQFAYDDLRVWNKLLSSNAATPQGQIQWHYQQMRMYDEQPPHDEVQPPAVILELDSDEANEYLLGNDYFVNLSFRVDLMYEEYKHQRIVNGETLSGNDLALWYAEELRRILWNTAFTTSALNEDSRDVYAISHQESHQQLYLYGCLGSFKIVYKGA